MPHHVIRILAFCGMLLGTSSYGYSGNAVQKVAGRTSQPIGHYEYCMANRKDCQIRTLSIKPVTLTRTRWSQMVETNAFANSTIEPVTDMEFYGVEEYWTIPKTAGDCEDFVLMKRQRLMELGWPPSALLATVVLQPNGEGHAVLTVRTDKADYVLDNLDGKIKPWNETPYKFLKRQSARHSGHWEDIVDSRMAVASIKRPTN